MLDSIDYCLGKTPERCQVHQILGDVVVFPRPLVFYPDTRLFEMPEDRSIDIDSDLDFTLVELLLRKRLASTETTS